MSTLKPLTEDLLKQIKDDLIFGYFDDNNIKQYPTVKQVAEHYKISYDSLRKKAGKWNWKQKRQNLINKVHRKVQEKKKVEEFSESEAEEIVVDDAKFNDAANELRQAAVNGIKDIKDKDVKGKAYQLMNYGKALESAQKVSKTAAGEPSEISKVEGVETHNQILLTDPDYIQAKKRAMDDYYVKQQGGTTD